MAEARDRATVAPNGTVVVASPGVERGIIEWGSVKGGETVWLQDIMTCSRETWELIRGETRYVGCHVSLFTNTVVVLSPGRSPAE